MRKYHCRNAFTHVVDKGFKIISNKREDFCLHSDVDIKGSNTKRPTRLRNFKWNYLTVVTRTKINYAIGTQTSKVLK